MTDLQRIKFSVTIFTESPVISHRPHIIKVLCFSGGAKLDDGDGVSTVCDPKISTIGEVREPRLLNPVTKPSCKSVPTAGGEVQSLDPIFYTGDDLRI